MAVVCALGIAGYIACGWSVGDALYMVVLTVYTVGFEEVRPIATPELRAVTIGLIVSGCTGMIFLTGALVQLITLSQFQQLFGSRRMQKDIDRLDGHVVVCGYGRMGQMLARELTAGKVACVVVERDEQRLTACRDTGSLCLAGDATDEDILRAAGVMRARALATVLPNDSANVFITLSARSLNRTLTIIARGELPSTERKLLQAGADRVVLPTHIGAERIAELILYADVARVLDGSGARDLRPFGLDLEVVAASEGSRCIGASVEQVERLAAGAFLIVAVNRRDGESVLQPPPGLVIAAGDGIAVVGRPGRAQMMGTIFEPEETTGGHP